MRWPRSTCGAALVARDFVEQALELGDVAVDRLLEVAVGAIFAGDLVEGLLARRRIEPLGESLALAALIAIPHFGGEVAIHQAADVERQRLQRIAAGGRLRRRPRARGLAGAPALPSVRLNRSDSHPSRPWSELAGDTGGASVRREAGRPRSGGGRVEALCRRRACAMRCCAAAAGGRQHRLFLALRRWCGRWCNDIEAAAVMGDDPVQFRQRLDLVDDHLAHLRGAFGGLLRHFQHAAAKLVAGGFQLVLHFGGHLLHARDHGGELFRGLLEHRIRFLRCSADRCRLMASDGQPAFLFGRRREPPRTGG